MAIKLLAIDDLEGIINLLRRTYAPKGITILGSTDLDEAREIFKKENPEIVILETFIRRNSEEFLKEVKKFNPKVIRIIFTTIHPADYERRCFEDGLCEYYFHKPLNDEESQKMEEAITKEAYKA